MADARIRPSASPPSLSVQTHFYGNHDEVVAVTLHEPAIDLTAVPEALVQDLWQHQHFDRRALRTTRGTPLQVLDPGTPNMDSGPDFHNAHVRIGATDWRGDVEIHVASRGWFDHDHHTDPRYNSVVLHVTLASDLWTGGLLREDGSPLPELLLRPHLTTPLRRLLYQFLTAETDALPCAAWWPEVPTARKDALIDRLAAERMVGKTQRLAERFLMSPRLEELLHEQVFAGLGYAKNTAPMTALARRLPLDLLRRIDDARDLEALHLGVAGLLPAPAELLEADRVTADYVMDLRHRFDRLQARFDVTPMERTQWRFFRLRPANFPPVRIAQAAALTTRGGLLHEDPIGLVLHALRQDAPLDALRALFDAPLSDFWASHLRLTHRAKPRSPDIGRTRRNTLIANAVVPVVLFYADQQEAPALHTAALDLLKHLPEERNHVLRRFRDLGTTIRTAYRSQGLLHLYRTRCTEGRCLTCPVAHHLLDRETMPGE
jgi:hypothetical protein